MKKAIFLTGATGLVGSYLLKILLRQGRKVYALARAKEKDHPRKRVEKALRFWDKGGLPAEASRNLKVLEGRITKKELGLSTQALNLLKNEVEEIFHCAAVTSFSWPLKRINNVNVDGTENILRLAEACQKKGGFQKVNHISTAYIYGDYPGTFSEDNLDVDQRFATNYEESKFKAEQVVEKYRRQGLWVDIYRPSIVVGDSQYGRTFQFKHIYQLINLCILRIFDVLPLKGSCISLVPIDLLAEAVYTISVNSRQRNQNYHPFPERHVSAEELLGAAGRLLRFRRPRFVLAQKFKTDKFTPVQKALLQNTILSVNFNMKLCSERTNNILKSYNFSMPDMDEALLGRILEYFIKKVL